MQYVVTTVDSEEPMRWMRHASITECRMGAQDSGYCNWHVTTTDGPALERALDRDADVISYQEVV